MVVGPIRYSTSLEMIEGCRAASDRLGVAGDEAMVSETVFTFEGGQAGSAQILEAGVTGIIAANDLMVAGVIAAARGWGVPSPTACRSSVSTAPRLTTMRQPIDRMSASATELLVDSIAGNGVSQTQVFAPELVAERSAGPVRPVAAVH